VIGKNYKEEVKRCDVLAQNTKNIKLFPDGKFACPDFESAYHN
jgi:hypothetical protein